MPEVKDTEKWPMLRETQKPRVRLYGFCPKCNQSGQHYLEFHKKYVVFHCEWCTPSHGLLGTNYDKLLELMAKND